MVPTPSFDSMRRYFSLIYLLAVFIIPLSAQSSDALNLEKTVYAYNNKLEYDSAQLAVQHFLADPKRSEEDKYYAYLYLSYIYKRLFDYDATFKYLNEALQHGLLTDRKDYFQANIDCQKALSLFDIHRYRESDSLMHVLARNQYAHLDEEYQAKIIMQEAYLLFLDKQYESAEMEYNKAIVLMQRSSPCDLPMIYAKKIELYGRTKQAEKAEATYQLSLQSAKDCGILKYTIYTKYMMIDALEHQTRYKEALDLRHEVDSLNEAYNTQEHLAQLVVLDQKAQSSLKDYQLKVKRQQLYSAIGISILLSIIVIALLYLYTLLRKKRDIIKHQNQLNEHIISMLSHDIKEPLLGVQLLLSKLKHEDAYLMQASQSLSKQIQSVNSILNNLLNTQKANASAKDSKCTAEQIQQIINKTIKDLHARYSSKQLNIQVHKDDDALSSLPISPEKLQIIIYNLLANAIKYSYEQGQIDIILDKDSISIKDYGIGILDSQTQQLLQEVVSSRTGTNNETGNGLGLYLIGQLIKDTAIKVKLKSAPEGGTLAKIIIR